MTNQPSQIVLIGVAGDSGCGKSTFLRRVTDLLSPNLMTVLGEEPTTVVCLDDYHCLDRTQRKAQGVTALNPKANNFDLMYEQIKALKQGQAIMKPIYNHETGKIDPPERMTATRILVVEGLHPMYDERVRSLLDFSVYLDIDDEVKIAWKIQRDMAERGHTYDDVLAAINARRPDFDAYVDPQKQYADVVIQILPTNLIPNDRERKVVRVRLIQKEGVKGFQPAYLFDQGSTIDWTPCGRKLTCSYPGIRLHYRPDIYYGQEVSILEIDGQFDRLEEVIYIENHLSNLSTKYCGEMTELLLKHREYPGSSNGSGLFQVLVSLKMRSLYEQRVSEHSALMAKASVN